MKETHLHRPQIHFIKLEQFPLSSENRLLTENGYFLTPFSSLLKKRVEERENKVAKPVLEFFFQDPIKFYPPSFKVR